MPRTRSSDGSPTGNPKPRVRVFIDFWNYELSMKTAVPGFRTDWTAIGRALAERAGSLVDPDAAIAYQGLNIYGSYDPANPNDRNLRHWMVNTLDRFAGVQVSLSERQRKHAGPRCPVCRDTVHVCPACGADMRGTEEKGVDVGIATDMIGLAWAGTYDVAVLVSADRDFIPVARFLDTRDIKVIHGGFPPQGSDLARHCWAGFSVPAARAMFERPPASP